MGFLGVKLSLAFQLSLLLLGSLTVSGEEAAESKRSPVYYIHAPAPAPAHHHHQAHAPAPLKPYPHPPPAPKAYVPAPAPAPKSRIPPPKPAPAPPKVLPPLPARTLVAVQGVVYCKSCKYPGVDTLLGATPISGATVKLQCNNTKYPTSHEATTAKNGYFFLQPPKTITTYGVHKCKVFLVKSLPSASCQLKTNLNQGISGAVLRYEKPKSPLSFALYSVGPFAFAPKC
ncbi:PREDICTED: non-classical arabinogalactan protein 31-like [Nelumbo nucifera]|uniref:Non-classical arabinogalactan protein 31-like n=2 Tax=Nelumbo nucifera TaxID=4432 RepID=A0A822XP37_NELNU|nr:PREDICTED: non-classical arabinogalactan protein 31-like [Nelumbo nucifera]DAD20971.1 TPA_asm: hypothetical protein HUJ06_022434 [Nelumbo nucifera]